MVVNFEFLGEEPIENVITCMHYKVDKVVFFGYSENIDRLEYSTEHFLVKTCMVKTVVFKQLSQTDLQSALAVMRSEVMREKEQGNQVYFDITGGESLALVAFGMLSRETETPMHMYDIENDTVIELDDGSKECLSRDVARQNIKLSLNLLIQLHGGIINEDFSKRFKMSGDDDVFMRDAEKIFEVARDYWDYWNLLSDFFRNTFVPVENLYVDVSLQNVNEALKKSKNKLNNKVMLDRLLNELLRAGALQSLVIDDKHYKFRFKSQKIKECLWEGGSILEIHNFHIESMQNDECRVGVHLDWDGIIHEGIGNDVLNEIDLLTLNGKTPTFVSCKSGKMDGKKTLQALYELVTVADRFGGKYARKVLIVTHQIGTVYVERARELGVEIRLE